MCIPVVQKACSIKLQKNKTTQLPGIWDILLQRMLWCLRLWAALIPRSDLKLRCSTALLTQQLFFPLLSHTFTQKLRIARWKMLSFTIKPSTNRDKTNACMFSLSCSSECYIWATLSKLFLWRLSSRKQHPLVVFHRLSSVKIQTLPLFGARN